MFLTKQTPSPGDWDCLVQSAQNSSHIFCAKAREAAAACDGCLLVHVHD